MDKNFILYVLIIGAGTMLALVLSWLGVKYKDFITQSGLNDTISGILDRLGTFAFAVVGELNQTIVAELKAAGRWNSTEAAKVKALALDKLRSYVGPEGIKEILDILGIDNATLQALLASFIESQVGSLKIDAKAAA